MWLFTKQSFLSIVSHRDRPNDCLVRARRREHIAKLFPKQANQIFEDKEADYRWRLVVSKKQAAAVVGRYIMDELTYDNFKGAQDPAHLNGKWLSFLHEIWHLGVKYLC